MTTAATLSMFRRDIDTMARRATLMSDHHRQSLQSQLLLGAAERGYRLMRNNVGRARAGNRVIAFGVGGPGGSDLIGWKQVEITPDMVGKKIAVFTAVEVKEGSGRATEQQKEFLDAVDRAGGVAILARRMEDLG